MFGFRGGSAGSIRRSRLRATPVRTMLSSFPTIKTGPRPHRSQLRWPWCHKRGKVTHTDAPAFHQVLI